MTKVAVILVCWLQLSLGSALAAAPENEACVRRLVVCLDGTLNNAERDQFKVGKFLLYKPTNVLKTFRAVLPTDSNGVDQISYYSEGVGGSVGDPNLAGRIGMRLDEAFGGVSGNGFEERVKNAYRFLVANFRPGDQIFIFGFSRGAAEAQSLVRFINWMGGILHKDDEYYIVELYALFRDRRAAPGEAQCRIAAIQRGSKSEGDDAPAAGAEHCKSPRGERSGPLPIQCPQKTAIRFLGVYDTVLSLGSRLVSDFTERDTPTVGPKYAFHVSKVPPSIVENVRQALAIDERRWDFRPQIWLAPSPDAPGQSLEQLWFPGVHSNIGGGFRNDGLADGALQWMVGEARACGLAVEDGFLAHYPSFVGGTRKNTDSGALRVYEILRCKYGRGVRQLDLPASAHASLHSSIAELLLRDPTYRPANLLGYLARHGEEIDRFPKALQSDVHRIVEQFRSSNPAACRPPRSEPKAPTPSPPQTPPCRRPQVLGCCS
ncbi:MAG TPA: DUF2235 domain-containing protein [Thermoanaerobaculia bacterium]